MTTKKLTFEDLVLDPWHRHVVGVLESIHGSPLPRAIKEGFVDVANFSGVQPRQAIQWVTDFFGVCTRILDGTANSSDFSIFWIRLHETLESLHDYFHRFNQLNAYPNLYAKIQSIRSIFSEEEKILIEYERHCNAHIFQSGYRINAVYNKGVLTEDGLYRKGKEKIETNRIIDEQLARWKTRDSDVARDFAKRLLGEIDSLRTLMSVELRQ